MPNFTNGTFKDEMNATVFEKYMGELNDQPTHDLIGNDLLKFLETKIVVTDITEPEDVSVNSVIYSVDFLGTTWHIRYSYEGAEFANVES